jgi:hypothetical protein
MLRTLLFIIGVAFAGTAAAQYKWVDQNGNVQYGDAPPAGVNAAPMRRSGPPVTYSQPEASDTKDGDQKDNAKKGPPTTAETDAALRKRQKEAEQDRQKQAKADQDAADKRENCARAQDYMRVLEGGRVARTDSKGERYFLDDAQLAQESVKARQSVREWCN